MTEINYKLAAEVAFFKHYVSNIYPSGVCSYVSDTYNFWEVITTVAKKAKPEILARKPNAIGLAKVVFRPDSGDPADILCGLDYAEIEDEADLEDLFMDDITTVKYPDGTYWLVEHLSETSYWSENVEYIRTDKVKQLSEAEVKGAVECLWDTFGGTLTETGHKLLDSHVGLIYGDSITLERANDIMQRLVNKGFASANVVFGIGSFTYQYVTRDTHGFAVKSTYGVIDGEAVEIFKDPVTDSGVKKSAKGLLKVEYVNGVLTLIDQVTPEESEQGELKVVFRNSQMITKPKLAEIRSRVEDFVSKNS